ncbi:hypothetical protein [Treponema primitia]|uniref:hypothetical protein n=1 Tax=Treponema primitia TaxID=88058 RepID=UPI0002554C97|nr:hypothetical protein [Treponema primitia]
MIQFYFLSILLNGLAGYTLVVGTGEEDTSLDTGFRLSLQNESCRLILGVLTIVMGFLKILSSVQGDVQVIGDLIPALAGFLAGFVLVFEYYRSRSTLEPEHTEKIEQLLIHNKKWIGFIALAAAALHFLFPTVLFL